MYVKILRKRGEIAPEEQFLLLSTIFCYLMLDFNVKTRIRFSLRDKRLFEITEVEITRVDCIKCFTVLAALISNVSARNNKDSVTIFILYTLNGDNNIYYFLELSLNHFCYPFNIIILLTPKQRCQL